MVDSVERGRQIGVQNPHPLGMRPFERGKQGTDGVGTTTTRAKPVGTRFEPGLPLGLQRVTDPRLMTPIHEHWNSEWALFAIGLRECTRAEPATGPRSARERCTRTATSARACDDKATSPSIPAVRRPVLRWVTCRTLTSVFDQEPNIIFCSDRTVAQSCSRVALKILRRSRATFSSWVPPDDGVPVEHALGSVHRRWCPTCPSVRQALGLGRSKAHLPTSAPFRARSHRPASGRFPATAAWSERPCCRGSRCLSATGIRFLGILSRRGLPPLLRSAYRP